VTKATIPRYREREVVIDNLLVRINFIIEMIWRTGLAPWRFESPFPGSLISALPYQVQKVTGIGGFVTKVTFTEDGSTLYCTGGGSLNAYDVSSGERLLEFLGTLPHFAASARSTSKLSRSRMR
jgi:hypothetical protein